MSTNGAARDFAFAIAVGPVARFIGGGRRSRDLWYGSRFLSEVTAAAGRALRDAPGVCILVPLRKRLDENFLDRSHERPTISNKILGFARDATAHDVRAQFAVAREKAQDFLVEQLQHLHGDPRCRALVIRSRIDAAIQAVKRGDFIEFYAAFTPVKGGDEQEALRRALKLLSARKNTRAFGAPSSLEGVPKSSLDPGRDTALDEDNPLKSRGKRLLVARRKLGIEGQERLDAISIARRRAVFVNTPTGAKLPKLPFPPLARVVTAPWLEGAERTSPRHLKEVREALEQLCESHPDALCLFSSPCREPRRKEEDKLFDFDPSLLLENGIEALLRAVEPKRRVGQVFPAATDGEEPPVEDSEVTSAVEEAKRTLEQIAPWVRELHYRLGPPQAYYALLEADGDGIGALLDQTNPTDREALVEALYAFADDAWGIIDKCDGCTFYAGADELTAYLPVDRALDAAVKLMALFQEKLDAAGQGGAASLSVGVVIAPLKDDLRETRRKARKALDHAKAQRRKAEVLREGWICVREEPRGGVGRISAGPVQLSASGETTGFHRDVQRWDKALAEQRLSMSTAHDLLELADRFERRGARLAYLPESIDQDGIPARCPAVGLDLARAVITQKPRRSAAADRSSGEDLATVLKERGAAWKTWADVRGFAHEVLLAERIDRVRAQRRREAEEAPR